MDSEATVTATHDELAGVVDLFGGLTRAELADALSELAYREGGQSVDEAAVDGAIEEALAAFALVRYDPEPAGDGDPLLVPGPTAFPALPAHGEDLPHILDVERRTLDREAVGEQAAESVLERASAAVDDGDAARVERLLDVTYDLEAWAPVELGDVRERLDAELEELH